MSKGGNLAKISEERNDRNKFHPQDARVEVDGGPDEGDGEDYVVDAGDAHAAIISSGRAPPCSALFRPAPPRADGRRPAPPRCTPCGAGDA